MLLEGSAVHISIIPSFFVVVMATMYFAGDQETIRRSLGTSRKAGAARREEMTGRQKWQMDVKKDLVQVSNLIKWSTPNKERWREN